VIREFLKRIEILAFLGLALSLSRGIFAQTHIEGQQLFEANCVACHTIGEGPRVGPDLAGIYERRSQEWLEKFVKDPGAVISSGDPYAVAMFEKYNKIAMPALPLSDVQIKSVLAYIQTKNDELAKAGTGAEPRKPEEALMGTQSEVERGRDLFQGKIRFVNSGAACNSCHHVKNDAVIGGGILAAELTGVFSRLGGVGVQAILGQPPFPVMQAAYLNKPLTEEENRSLVVFLQHADKEQAYQQPRDYGVGLFVSGSFLAVFLLGLYAFIWRNRKKRSVNQEIFDRQISSISDDEFRGTGNG